VTDAPKPEQLPVEPDHTVGEGPDHPEVTPKPPGSLDRPDRGLDEGRERLPNAGDFIGSDPEDTSAALKSVEPPDQGAPTAPESSEETGDTPKVSGERSEGTKVKAKSDDDRSIADEAIHKAKEEERDRAERSQKFRDDLKDHQQAVNEVFQKQDDLGEVERKDREIPPAEQAVHDVLLEAQRRAAESVKASQATVAATALARMGVEATLDASNPGERVALSSQRQEIVDRVARAIAELKRYDETAPELPDFADANLDNLAVVGPDQTIQPEQPEAPTYQPKKRAKPDDIVNGIIDRVIELVDGGGHDYYTARKLLQTVEKRLGARWTKHRDKRKAKSKSDESFDPNHHVNPVDGSGQRFNTYANSAGMIGNKQISSPEYMVPFRAPDPAPVGEAEPKQATVGGGE
jgi:hypothetical protein